MSQNPDEVIPRHARGRRPHFFEDPSTDKLLAVVLELTQELSVLRERVDTMQKLLDRRGALPSDEVEGFVADPEVEAERARIRQEYLQRVFRVLRHEHGSFSPKEAETHTQQTEINLAAAVS
jgi:hypothetical protein